MILSFVFGWNISFRCVVTSVAFSVDSKPLTTCLVVGVLSLLFVAAVDNVVAFVGALVTKVGLA